MHALAYMHMCCAARLRYYLCLHGGSPPLAAAFLVDADFHGVAAATAVTPVPVVAGRVVLVAAVQEYLYYAVKIYEAY